MKKIINYFVDNSIVVNLLTILIIIIGLMSVYSLNKETFPNVDFNYITITTAYPGTAAEDIEKLVTIEIERKLKGVGGIDELNAMSAEGASIVSLKLDPDVESSLVIDDVRDALSGLSAKVPADVERPIIKNLTNKDRRSLLTIALVDDNEMKLRQAAKKIRDSIESISEVAEVNIDGYRDEIFDIAVEKRKLERYDVSLTEILNAIKDRQINITSGNLKLESGEKLIRTLVENKTVKDLEDIVVRSNDSGDIVQVKDLASVRLKLKEADHLNRSDGKFALFLSVNSKTQADVIETADKVKKIIEKKSTELKVKYKVSSDMSYYVKRRLGVLSENGLQGIVLVTICLIFFMNVRVSIITALGAPFAFLVAFALMDSVGITINLISMFGLILVLGMLVDDSIIVSEQYYQYIEKGIKPKQAAKKAAWDTLGPVTSTVLTTMVAFSSLFFMDGIMGKFLWPVPAVIIICLIASWFECFLILPGHLADFAANVKNVEKTRWYKPLQDMYERSLAIFFKYAKTTILVFIILFFGALGTLSTMKFELFPADDVTWAYLNIKGPVGSSLNKTNDVLSKIEEIVQKQISRDELVGFRTVAGYQRSKGSSPKVGSHYGSIFIELTMNDFRERDAAEILNSVSKEIKNHIGNYTFSLELMKSGPPTGSPVNIEITSDSTVDLISASQKIKKLLDDKIEVVSSEIDYEKGKKQIIVNINEKETRRLGVTNLQIALELRNAFEGLVATTIKKSDEDVDVIVRLNEAERSSEQTLKSLKIPNQMGNRIPLVKLATFKEVDGSYVIRRLERKKTFSISAAIDREKTTSVKMNKSIDNEILNITKSYKNMEYKLAGESEDAEDSLASFKKALVASTFIIFILLVVQFSSLSQPLIVMSAIPFGLVGVVAAFKIFGLSIGFMALMGMLGLVGVVINDSIVLVTFINRYLEEKGDSIETILKASISRFRPVLLTTITTVAGLLPVAHMPGGDPFLKPMALSFAYGLIFSTTITLIFVPTSYLLYMKFLKRV